MSRRRSAVMLLGATAALAACSGDNPGGGEPGDGGTLDGASGSDTRGPDGSGGPDGGAPAGQATIKFCNALSNGDDSPFEAEMVIGQLRLKALTGACSTGKGQPCTTMPAGPADMSLRRAVGGQVLATRQFTFQAGIEYVALTEFDDATGTAQIISQALSSATKCSSLGFDELFVRTPPSTDAGAPPPNDAG